MKSNHQTDVATVLRASAVSSAVSLKPGTRARDPPRSTNDGQRHGDTQEIRPLGQQQLLLRRR